MIPTLAVVQHHSVEGVGEIGGWADRRGIAVAIHRSDLGELPQEVDGPCVLLGGPHSVNAPPDWLQREKVWLRATVARKTPLLGICLGSQLLAEALGGRVHTLDAPETGWTRIAFADGSALDALQWHEDTFTLPAGGACLASSAACRQQMFRVGAHVGIQFHPEWNAALVQALNAHFGEASPLPREAEPEKHALATRWFHHQLDAWWNTACGNRVGDPG